jgi:hypothetical protein
VHRRLWENEFPGKKAGSIGCLYGKDEAGGIY